MIRITAATLLLLGVAGAAIGREDEPRGRPESVLLDLVLETREVAQRGHARSLR
ncbi:MAG: hypothetical protein MUE73_16005 [Planctomycetes bacterium]|jgi:hypothetical protein|nr:hypothetical protein [Planctomycetota bacterium]